MSPPQSRYIVQMIHSSRLLLTAELEDIRRTSA